MRKLFVSLFLCLWLQGHAQIEYAEPSVTFVSDNINNIVSAQKTIDGIIFNFKLPAATNSEKFKPGTKFGMRFNSGKVVLADGETIPVSDIKMSSTAAQHFSRNYAWEFIITDKQKSISHMAPPIHTMQIHTKHKNTIPTLAYACCIAGTGNGIFFEIKYGHTIDDLESPVYVVNNWVFADNRKNATRNPLVFAVTGTWVDTSYRNPEGYIIPQKEGLDLDGNIAAKPAHGDSSRSEITQGKGIKKGMGRLSLAFPAGVYWSVDIYSAANKFIINRSIETYKLKHYDLAPGTYNLKLNTVLVENVVIEEGKVTRVKAGILEVGPGMHWELTTENKK